MNWKSWWPVFLVVAFFIGRYFYFKPAVGSGEQAPIIEGTLLDGSPFNLRDLSGKYVLVDFWGSWCPPCRAANPSLVELYRKAKDQNLPLEIVSIGIERDNQSWRRAIEADGLVWKYHLSTGERFKGPIARAYGVRQIPTSFLLAQNQEIIAVNPQFDDLIAKYLTK